MISVYIIYKLKMAKNSLTHLVIAMAVFGLLYYLIQNYDSGSVSYALNNYVPSEKIKTMDFNKFNELPPTLEEDIVSKMSPILKNDYSVLLLSNESSYKPILNPLHDASPIE